MFFEQTYCGCYGCQKEQRDGSLYNVIFWLAMIFVIVSCTLRLTYKIFTGQQCFGCTSESRKSCIRPFQYTTNPDEMAQYIDLIPAQHFFEVCNMAEAFALCFLILANVKYFRYNLHVAFYERALTLTVDVLGNFALIGFALITSAVFFLLAMVVGTTEFNVKVGNISELLGSMMELVLLQNSNITPQMFLVCLRYWYYFFCIKYIYIYICI